MALFLKPKITDKSRSLFLNQFVMMKDLVTTFHPSIFMSPEE